MFVQNNNKNLLIAMMLIVNKISFASITNVIFVVFKDFTFVKNDAILIAINFIVVNDVFVATIITSLRSIKRSFFHTRFF